MMSFSERLQSLCKGCVSFEKWVLVTGNICVTVETGENVQYNINEKLCKSDEHGGITSFSNSFHSVKDVSRNVNDPDLVREPPQQQLYQKYIYCSPGHKENVSNRNLNLDVDEQKNDSETLPVSNTRHSPCNSSPQLAHVHSLPLQQVTTEQSDQAQVIKVESTSSDVEAETKYLHGSYGSEGNITPSL